MAGTGTGGRRGGRVLPLLLAIVVLGAFVGLGAYVRVPATPVHRGVDGGANGGANGGAIPALTVDRRGAGGSDGARLAPTLFGIGADLPAATYTQAQDAGCAPLTGFGASPTLVRIGASTTDTADSYDWRTDAIAPIVPAGRSSWASFGCSKSTRRYPAVSVLRVLDAARARAASSVVVLDGEVDDPQSAAGEVGLIVRRYGAAFARAIYWEIGAAPANWRYFGAPLTRRRAGMRLRCAPDQYAALVTGYAAAIAAALGTDASGAPAVPRIVADAWITNATDQSWTRVVTAVDTSYYPFSSLGARPATRAAVARSVSDPPADDAVPLDQPLDRQIEGLRANLDQYSGGGGVGVLVGQWNIDVNTSSTNPVYASAAQGVFVARMLLRLAHDGVTLAAWAPPLYGSTGIGSTDAPFVDGRPTPGYRVFAALRRLAGARLSPLAPASSSRVGDLEAWALRSPHGRMGESTTVVLINAGARAAARDLRLVGASTRAFATVRTFAAASPGGAATTRAVAPRDRLRLVVPAFGVTLVTIGDR